MGHILNPLTNFQPMLDFFTPGKPLFFDICMVYRNGWFVQNRMMIRSKQNNLIKIHHNAFSIPANVQFTTPSQLEVRDPT